MAIQRLSLTNLKDLVRFWIGEEIAALSKIPSSNVSGGTTASLATVINLYGQQIPSRLALIMREQGYNIQAGQIYPDWLRTSGSMTETEGSSDVTFPSDYARYISFYDRTNRRVIWPTEEVSSTHLERLKKRDPGPPEAIEILGVNSSSVWTGTLWPPTEGGITPDIELIYWRLPASMADSNPGSEYPDAPPEFHILWAYGAVLEIMRPDDPAYSRFQDLERQKLTEMVYAARML